jgi:hypothetical protein
VNGSDVPPVTVKVAVPVTIVLSGFVAIAVMVLVPWLNPLASPVELMVAMEALLELHRTWLVRSSVAPDEVVPIAMNWLVWPGDATDWVPGIMVRDVRSPPPVLPLPVTVTEAVLLVIRPPNPCMVAVIVTVPEPTPVTKPAALTVATLVLLEFQVTVVVMLVLVEGWLPWPTVPMAVSCAVAPVPNEISVGEIVMESTSEEEPQPANGTTRLTNSNDLKQKRPSIELLLTRSAG